MACFLHLILMLTQVMLGAIPLVIHNSINKRVASEEDPEPDQEEETRNEEKKINWEIVIAVDSWSLIKISDILCHWYLIEIIGSDRQGVSSNEGSGIVLLAAGKSEWIVIRTLGKSILGFPQLEEKFIFIFFIVNIAIESCLNKGPEIWLKKNRWFTDYKNALYFV